MAKKSKLATPAWILEGFDSEADYNKAMQETKSPASSKQSNDSSMKGFSGKKKDGKTFKIRECPTCGSDDVGIVLSNSDSEEESNTGKNWECRKCGWNGSEIVEKELTENELMSYLDSKGEEVN